MRSKVTDLREKRAAAFEEMQGILDQAEQDKRSLTAEETQEFQRVESEFDDLTEEVRRVEKMEGIRPTLTRAAVNGDEDETRVEERQYATTLAEFNEQRRGVLPQDQPEYRHAFYRWLTSIDDRELEPAELRVLSKASAGAGLNLVPTNFQKTLIDQLRFMGVMRDIATVITTDSGATLQIPTVSSHGTASWTSENATYSASDEAFGQSSLSAYKAATLIKVSEELLADSAFDLEAYIRTQFGLRIGVLENTGFVVGDGSGKPTGVATQASAGVTAAGAAAITGDDLIGLYHSLLPPYRRNAVWVLNDSSIKLIRGVKETTGNYIWQPGLQAGVPDMLLGKPVYADPDMAAATTTQVSALFGDFSYYWIRDVNGIAFQRLNELYAESGQIGFRALHRTDGKLLNTAAVKKLTQA